MLRLRFFRVALRFFLGSYFVLFFRLSESEVFPLLAIALNRLGCCTFDTPLSIRRMFFFVLEAVPHDILVVRFLLLSIRLTLSPSSLRYYLGFVEIFC
jgi:hypothetical protein